MSDFTKKVKVVLTAAPSALAVVSMVLTVFVAEIVPLLPENAGVRISAVVASILAWIAAIVRVISRVTPVVERERGLLPQRPPVKPWVPPAARARGQ
jgi:predicted neuraminidase